MTIFLIVLSQMCLIVSFSSYTVSGYDLGASCEYDEDCVADHSYCRNQQVCQCRRGFNQAPDGISCRATVGARCQTKFDCMTLEHSGCQSDVCKCEVDFVPDASGIKCLPRVLEMKGLCQQDNQCQASFGDQSRCYGGHCECFMKHHFLNGRCFLTRDLNEYCSNSSECYIGSEYTKVVECAYNKCQCVRGYYIDQYRKCKYSAGFTGIPIQKPLLLLAITILYQIQDIILQNKDSYL